MLTEGIIFSKTYFFVFSFSSFKNELLAKTLTSLPNVEYILAISQAIIPPPIIFNLSGISSSFNMDDVKNICNDVKAGKLNVDDITEETITNNLFTKDYPQLDLMIRTSGEYRISNYLLWQMAYSELYFTDVLWPDFNTKELHKALIDFQGRNRRFGGLKDDKNK